MGMQRASHRFTCLTKVEARDLVASFYEELTLALETGESVFLAGFGEFRVTEGRVSFSPALKA